MKPFLRTRTPRHKPVKGSAIRRALRGALYAKLGLILFIGLALGTLYVRLSVGPLSFGRLPERVAEALGRELGWDADRTAAEVERFRSDAAAEGILVSA